MEKCVPYTTFSNSTRLLDLDNMKLYKIENLCKGEWIVRSVWARDFRYMVNVTSEKPETRNCLRIRRVTSKQEAKEILAIEGITKTPFINIDEIEWETA